MILSRMTLWLSFSFFHTPIILSLSCNIIPVRFILNETQKYPIERNILPR